MTVNESETEVWRAPVALFFGWLFVWSAFVFAHELTDRSRHEAVPAGWKAQAGSRVSEGIAQRMESAPSRTSKHVAHAPKHGMRSTSSTLTTAASTQPDRREREREVRRMHPHKKHPCAFREESTHANPAQRKLEKNLKTNAQKLQIL